MQEIKLKRCSTCKVEKTFEEFGKDKNRKDGLNPRCKGCLKQCRNKNKNKLLESNKKYREQNKEKIAEKKKSHYIQNKDKIADKQKEYRKQNKEKIAEKKKSHYIQNKDKIAEKGKEYREKNKDKIAEKGKEYRKRYAVKHRDKLNSKTAKRRAQKLKATPPWLTPEHFEEITEFYTACKMFQIYTGLTYHVDHIVPLQGETVCGLHVPWNLQILEAHDNHSKSNKLIQEEIDSTQ